jgi:cyanase
MAPVMAGNRNKEQAEKIGAIFGLADEAVAWLQIAPCKGSLPAAVPADPLIYRWYEIVAVYGTTIKELIHEEFGDGIMSAIDFSMNISREADPKGDRVKVIMSGKCLPYENLLSERRAPTPLPARHAWWVVRPAHSSKPTRKRVATFVGGTGHAFGGTVSTRRLGNSDLNITPVGFGACAIGGTGYDFAWGKQASRGSTGAS